MPKLGQLGINRSILLDLIARVSLSGLIDYNPIRFEAASIISYNTYLADVSSSKDYKTIGTPFRLDSIMSSNSNITCVPT